MRSRVSQSFTQSHLVSCFLFERHARSVTTFNMATSAKDELGKKKSHYFNDYFDSRHNTTNGLMNGEFIVNVVVFTELLERAFLRVASAETDEQLERTVATFLSPLLLKVASPHQEVKNKVKKGNQIIFH